MRSRVKSALTLPLVVLLVATALSADERVGSIRVIRGRTGADARGSATIKSPTRSTAAALESRAAARGVNQRAELTRADVSTPMPNHDGETSPNDGVSNDAAHSGSSLGVPLPPGMPRGLIDNYDSTERQQADTAPSGELVGHPVRNELRGSDSAHNIRPSTATVISGAARSGDAARGSHPPTELEPISVQLPPLGLKDEIAQWLRQLAVVMIGLLVMLPALLLVLKRLVLPGVVIRVELAGSGVAVTTTPSPPTVAAATTTEMTTATTSAATLPVAFTTESTPARRGAAADLSGGGLPVELLSSIWANEQQNEEQHQAAQKAELLKCLFESNRDLQSQRTALTGSAVEPSVVE